MSTKGIESLSEAVLKDCKGGEDCFNSNGCDKVRYKDLPQDNINLVAMGIKTKCVAQTKCFHDYCGKYKWIIERAKHYAEKTGKTHLEILEAWEEKRSYWYMNYYQDSKQPLLEGENILMYEDWIKKLKERFGNDAKKWAFVCPSCKNTQTIQDFIDNKIEEPENKVYFSCIGRYVTGKGCDWTLGGLLHIHEETVIKDGTPIPVFKIASK